MANPNPVKARLAQRRRRKPGDLPKLMKAVWETIRDVEAALETAATPDDTCRAAHAMAACANAYNKLLQMGEYEGRLAALEAALAAMKGVDHGGA
jgi:alcohol dehydrogenase YqhD (iron-dependent ADH family)